MSWITITEDDLLTVMSGPELKAIRAAALKTDQPDPVEPTLLQVADQVRGSVGACENNRLGVTGTIPQKLLTTALDIAAYRIPSRVGITPKESRTNLYKDALALLKEVAACRFDIEEPVEQTNESSGFVRPIINGRPPHYGRHQQDGL